MSHELVPRHTGTLGDTWQLRPSRMPTPEQEAQCPGPRDTQPDLPSLTDTRASHPCPGLRRVLHTCEHREPTLACAHPWGRGAGSAPRCHLPPCSTEDVAAPGLPQTGTPGGQQPPGTGPVLSPCHAARGRHPQLPSQRFLQRAHPAGSQCAFQQPEWQTEAALSVGGRPRTGELRRGTGSEPTGRGDGSASRSVGIPERGPRQSPGDPSLCTDPRRDCRDPSARSEHGHGEPSKRRGTVTGTPDRKSVV